MKISRCVNCRRPIYNGTYAESGNWEPDYDSNDDPAGVWRHKNGYAWCGELFAKPGPEIITLCGSTKFMDDFLSEMRRLSLVGKIVIPVGLWGHTEGLDIGTADAPTDVKVRLDVLHFRKIDISNSIHVINKNQYIGSSTANEIRYAAEHGKRITFMEPATECFTLSDGTCIATACVHVPAGELELSDSGN